MNMIIKFLVWTIVTFALMAKGSGEDCSLENINIGTVRSGRVIEGRPEWNVSVINNCKCPQSLIKLSCRGFQTVEEVDPSVLAKQGDDCLLINGTALQAFASVSFSYAWDPPFLLLPHDSLVAC